jgi:alkylation response protein AidB-like acyl-CoA dehydrogenase
MDYFLTEEQKMIVDLGRKFAIEKIKPVRDHYEESGEFPWAVFKELAQSDLCGVYIAEEYGGFGKGVFDFCLLVEELSKIDGAMALAVAASALGTIPIINFGSDAQKKKYLPDIASGRKFVAFGITEPNAGSDVAAIKTSAVKNDKGYLLNGTKCFITNAGEAEIYVVIAITDKSKGIRGASAFILEKGMPGFDFGKKENKMGIRASATCELVFNNCQLPKENLLGKEGMGFIVAMKAFENARPGVAAQALGIAAGALDDAVDYTRQRVQFGKPIASIQAVQHMLADMALKIEAARALLYATARTIDAHKTERFIKDAAMCKVFASDVAMEVTTNAVQVCGGYGYMKEYPFEKRMRDAKITQIYEGTNQVLRNEIGLALVKESIQK